MNAWIIFDNDSLARKISDCLRSCGINCTPRLTSHVESFGALNELLNDFEGLVFLAIGQFGAGHLELLRRVRGSLGTSSRIVVVSSLRDHAIVLNAIRAGAYDFLGADENLENEIVSFTHRVRSEQNQKRFDGSVVSIVPCHSSGDASLIASNVSALISMHMGACALLDFHLRGGDLALLLKLTPRHTLFDLLNQSANIDEAMLDQAFTQHESGIRLLAGPSTFVDLKNIRPQVCQQVIALARQLHPFVVVNSEDVQHAEQIRALGMSDRVILTIRLDVVSLFRAKQHVEFMTRNQVEREQIHVVALGTGYSSELPEDAIKKVLQPASISCIPDDPVSVIRSINVGNPIVLESPHTKIAQSIQALSQSLFGFTDEKPRPNIAAMKAAAVLALNTLPFCK